jgi:hypothetical protein
VLTSQTGQSLNEIVDLCAKGPGIIEVRMGEGRDQRPETRMSCGLGGDSLREITSLNESVFSSVSQLRNIFGFDSCTSACAVEVQTTGFAALFSRDFLFMANDNQFDFRVPGREENFIQHSSHQVESVRTMTLGEAK